MAITVGEAKRIAAAIDATLSNEAALNEKVSASFQRLDRDRSGHVDMIEARQLVQELCMLMHLPPPTEDDFRNHVQWLDADNSGGLSFDEVKRGVAGALAHKAGAMRHFLAFAQRDNLPDDAILPAA